MNPDVRERRRFVTRMNTRGDVVKTERRTFYFCTVQNCGREHYAKGFCHLHYSRMRRTGDIHGRMPEPGKPPVRLPRRTDAPWCRTCGMTLPKHWANCKEAGSW